MSGLGLVGLPKIARTSVLGMGALLMAGDHLSSGFALTSERQW